MANTVETRQRFAKSWNFGTSQHPLTLDEFLKKKSLQFKFFDGSEPWVRDLDHVTWENFFRFCTEELDDLSMLTCGMVIEYCLSVIEEAKTKLKRQVSRTSIQDALNAGYEEAYENAVFQYRWAMRHPVVSEAVKVAVRNLAERD
jgi:hypothetical protein